MACDVDPRRQRQHQSDRDYAPCMACADFYDANNERCEHGVGFIRAPDCASWKTAAAPHRSIAGAIPSVELEKTGSYSAAAGIFGWAGFAPEASAPASDLAA